MAAGPGGGLAEAFERLGPEPLAALLAEHPEVEAVGLEDGGLAVRAVRAGGAALLEVAWSGGPRWSEPLQLPLPAAPGGEVGGRQEAPSAPVEGIAPASAAGPPGVPTTLLDDPLPAIHDPDRPLWVLRGEDGEVQWADALTWGAGPGARPVLAHLPANTFLGSRAFCRAFGVDLPVVAGAMAGGIASVELVAAMAGAGLLAFYGAGGLDRDTIARDLDRLADRIGDRPYGVNLLHNPHQPAEEEAVVDLYLQRGCRLVSASAYMRLTPALVRFRVRGLARDAEGRPLPRQRVFAKLSRPEVAEQFLRPPPAGLLRELVDRGAITRGEAELAARLPVADAITCEADSGGHTDGRPLPVLLPIVRRLRDRLAASGEAPGAAGVFLGAAGGIGSPEAVRAAFALGADYVLTGSVNQCTVEAGTSDLVRRMLAEAGMADVARGIAPDMFELGAEVQVLRRGTMWPQRSRLLHETWKAHRAWEEVPPATRRRIETRVLGRSFGEVWEDCVAFWKVRDPGQLERAARDPRHRMALVFRWYLGMSSRWARQGREDRKRDFQVWCGAAMGAFNDWVRGSPLEPPAARSVVRVNRALWRGALVLARAERLVAAGVSLPPGADRPVPR